VYFNIQLISSLFIKEGNPKGGRFKMKGRGVLIIFDLFCITLMYGLALAEG